MIEIIPAILSDSFAKIEEHLAKIRGVTSLVQIDIVDGHFAKNRTWPYKDHDSFEKLLKEEPHLGVWEEFTYQFDLMVEKPLEHLDDFLRVGPKEVIIHESSENALEAMEKIITKRTEDPDLEHLQVGIAIGCDVQPDVLEPFEAQYDFVQVMGIEKIGYQGQELDKRALYLLERLHHRYPTFTFQVDGGVKLENAAALVGAGANRLVAGSAIFGADDPKAALALFKEQTNAH